MSTRKRILLVLTAVLLLGAGVFAFLRLRKMEEPARDPLTIIPNSAFCLVSSQNIHETWKNLSVGNLAWDAMGETEWATAVTHSAAFVDSVLTAEPAIAELFDGQRCWFSLHCTGIDDFDFVLATSLPSPGDADDFSAFVKKNTAGKKIAETEWKQNKLITIGETGKGGFTIALREGVILVSGNAELLKTGLEQIDKNVSLLNDPGFAAVKKTAGEKANANVYINYERLRTGLNRLSSDAYKTRIDDIAPFAGWTEMDASFRPNALLLNGYTYSNDTFRQYLGTLSGQQPQLIEADQVLPASTISYVDYGISNIDLYFDRYAAYLDHAGLSDLRSKKLGELMVDYHFNPRESIGKWLGNELALAEIPSPSGDITSVALLSTTNTALAKASLEKLQAKNDSTPKISADSSGYTIRKAPVPQMLAVTFGSLFSDFQEAYYTIIRQYVVFAPDEATLRSVIAANENKQVLLRERTYADFVTNMSDEASLTLYVSPARSEKLLQSRVSGSFAADLKKHSALLRRFDGAVLQYSTRDNGLFYTNIFLRHNPQGKKEVSTLWETQLDSSFSGTPWLVKDHKTKGLDVFLQDDGNTIYLVSSTGSVMWKRKLPEKIIGDVQQVDALKNEKFQLVFNTASAIYIIDRNGNDLSPFPVKLSAKATNPVTVFDYENNREYRLLVACADKHIYNYTIKGQKVDGWKLPVTDDIVFAPLEHTIVGAKDYIIAVDRSGKTCITDRQGALRLKLKERLNAPVKTFFLETGKELSRTRIVACDSLGNVSRLSLSDDLERLHFLDFQESPGFEYRDLDGDGSREFIFLDSRKLMAFDQDKNVALSFSFDAPAKPFPQLFAFDAKDIRVGASCANNELHLINKGGADSEGFPLPGSTSFSIGRLNGEAGFTLVCGNNGRYLCAYAMH